MPPRPRPKTVGDERFRRNILQMRKELELSRGDVAERTGLSERYIKMLEEGERTRPPIDTLRRLASALGRTVDDLDAENPGPYREELLRRVAHDIIATPEERELIPDTVEWALRKLNEIHQRVHDDLKKAKAASKSKPHRR